MICVLVLLHVADNNKKNTQKKGRKDVSGDRLSIFHSLKIASWSASKRPPSLPFPSPNGPLQGTKFDVQMQDPAGGLIQTPAKKACSVV